MSTANHIFSSLRARSATATTASVSAPVAAARAAASATMPSPPQALAESITITRRPLSRSIRSAAWRAPSTVPEIPPEMWIETTSWPASTSGS